MHQVSTVFVEVFIQSSAFEFGATGTSVGCADDHENEKFEIAPKMVEFGTRLIVVTR